jgi:hypothetical protein
MAVTQTSEGKYHTLAKPVALDESGAGDSVLPRGGKADGVEPGLSTDAGLTLGDSILRSRPGGLIDPAAALGWEWERGLRALGKGEV